MYMQLRSGKKQLELSKVGFWPRCADRHAQIDLQFRCAHTNLCIPAATAEATLRAAGDRCTASGGL